MSLKTSIHLRLARVKDTFINGLCRLGLVADPQTLTVNGVSAQFRVASASERWRVQDAMGERPILEQFIEEVRDGDCFWDIGGAVGTYSCLAVNAGASAVVFEPHPINNKRCCENLELNGAEATVYAIALSDESGAMNLSEDAGVGSGMHRLSESGKIEVNVERGDAVDCPCPDIMKIDVEGHEGAVLDGMAETLNSVRIAFVECHPHMGVSVEEIRNQLEAGGLSVETVNSDRFNEVFLVARRV